MKLSAKHKLFADTYLSTGDAVAAYQKAYAKASTETARVNGYKLLQKTTIADYIKGINDKINAGAQNKLIDKLSEKEAYILMSYTEKRELLSKIARGEIEIPIKKPMWDSENGKFVMLPMIEVADHSTRMRAIDLDNKMTGHEAPKKIANTDKDGNDVKPFDYSKLTTDELLFLKTVNEKCST